MASWSAQPYVLSVINLTNPLSGQVQLLPPVADTYYIIGAVDAEVNASTYTAPSAAASLTLSQGLNPSSVSPIWTALYGWPANGTLIAGSRLYTQQLGALLGKGAGLYLSCGNSPTNGGWSVNVLFTKTAVPILPNYQQITQ